MIAIVIKCAEESKVTSAILQFRKCKILQGPHHGLAYLSILSVREYAYEYHQVLKKL